MNSPEDNGGLDLGAAEDDGVKDPFAEVPAEVEPEADEQPEAGAPVEEPVAEEAAPEEPVAEEQDPPPLPGEPVVEDEPEPEAKVEPEDAAAAASEPEAKGQSEPETKKEGTTERLYMVLVQTGERTFEAIEEPIKATNGEVALRQAYATLVPEDSEESKTLVVVPVHYWKPKEVKAKKQVSRAVEIG